MTYFLKIKEKIINLGFNIISENRNKPWGGFLVIEDSQIKKFVDEFFDGINVHQLKDGGKLSPKILILNPNSKLSWQYHKRRDEIWKVFKGKVGVSVSMDNQEKPMIVLEKEDQINLKSGVRHRLIGLKDYAVVLEIWRHIDPQNLSDENDIIRVADDYGRSNF